MKKNLFILTILISLAVLMGCSKEDKIAEQNKPDAATQNQDEILKKLEKAGIDISKKFAPVNRLKSQSDFFEAWVDYKMARGENWSKLFWRFNWSFCAPEGRYIRMQYYIVGGGYQRIVNQVCFNAGDGGDNGCYHDGIEESVYVVAQAWMVSNSNPNDAIYAGYVISGPHSVALSGLCDSNPY